jgi:hypothetical protein
VGSELSSELEDVDCKTREIQTRTIAPSLKVAKPLEHLHFVRDGRIWRIVLDTDFDSEQLVQAVRLSTQDSNSD